MPFPSERMGRASTFVPSDRQLPQHPGADRTCGGGTAALSGYAGVRPEFGIARLHIMAPEEPQIGYGVGGVLNPNVTHALELQRDLQVVHPPGRVLGKI